MERLLEIAKSELEGLQEVVNGLPAPQVTVLETAKRTYVAVNDTTGNIAQELQANQDTKILRMVTLWKNGQMDVAAYEFRRAILLLNEWNENTQVLLRTEEGIGSKPLAVVTP